MTREKDFELGGREKTKAMSKEEGGRKEDMNGEERKRNESKAETQEEGKERKGRE